MMTSIGLEGVYRIDGVEYIKMYELCVAYINAVSIMQLNALWEEELSA